MERPLPADSRALAHNRWLAGELCHCRRAVAAHRAVREPGQAFFRAARLIDEADRNIQVLCSEGNLGVLPWLDPPSREVIEELVAGADRRSERSSKPSTCPEEPSFYPGILATRSISTSAPKGSAATWTVERAGRCSPTASP